MRYLRRARLGWMRRRFRFGFRHHYCAGSLALNERRRVFDSLYEINEIFVLHVVNSIRSFVSAGLKAFFCSWRETNWSFFGSSDRTVQRYSDCRIVWLNCVGFRD